MLNRYHHNQITRKTSKKSVAVVHQNTGSIVYMLHVFAENEEDQNKTVSNGKKQEVQSGCSMAIGGSRDHCH